MRWRRMAATAVRRPVVGERDALVGAVVDQLAVGEPLDERRDRAGGEAEGVGEHAGVRLGAVAREAVDRLQRFAFGLGQLSVHIRGFGASKPRL